MSLAYTARILFLVALGAVLCAATSPESSESPQLDTSEYRVQLTQGDTLEFDLNCKVKGQQAPNAPLDGTFYFELHRKDVFPFKWINRDRVFTGSFRQVSHDTSPLLIGRNEGPNDEGPNDGYFLCRLVTSAGESILGLSAASSASCPACKLYRKGSLVSMADFEVLANPKSIQTAWVNVSNPDWKYIPDSAFLISEPLKGGQTNGSSNRKHYIGRVITPEAEHYVLSVPESVPQEEEVKSPFAVDVKYSKESVYQVLVATPSEGEKDKLGTLVCEQASGPLSVEAFTEEVQLGVKMVTETGEEVTGFVEGLSQQIFKKVV